MCIFGRVPTCLSNFRNNPCPAIFVVVAQIVGCIQVHLFDDMLLLRAAKPYPSAGIRGGAGGTGGGSGGAGEGAFVDEDPLAHITNTARQAEDESFSEEDK